MSSSTGPAAKSGRRRILIDGRMAADVGGGFTYLANIVPRLLRLDRGSDFLLVLRNERLARCLPQAENLEVRMVRPLGPLGRLAFTFRDGPRLAREWGADLYFSVSEYAPASAPCPVVASFRNPNVFTSMDQGWAAADRLRLLTLRLLARASARACDRIMFVSEDSARWIGDTIGLPESRRAVVRHGIDLERWTGRPGCSPHRRPYILSVSTIYRYKNFVRLIQGYARLAAQRPGVPDLVIVGDNRDPAYLRRMETARLKTGPLAGRIHFVGEVPYDTVQSYYAGAALFVFPSYLETFGHPMLEAMASGVPIVASDIGVFREIGGDAAFYVDPHSPEAFARAMEQALFEAEARKQLVKRGWDRVREFTWDRSATRLTSLFEEVISAREVATRPAVADIPDRELAYFPPASLPPDRLART